MVTYALLLSKKPMRSTLEAKMAVLCREFGISRKTGYKIFRR